MHQTFEKLFIVHLTRHGRKNKALKLYYKTLELLKNLDKRALHKKKTIFSSLLKKSF